MLLTAEQVEEVIGQLNVIQHMEWHADEVSSVHFRVDVFAYGGLEKVERHIDLDFTFGEYVELWENEGLYQYIFDLCHLQEMNEDKEREREILLYQKSTGQKIVERN